MPKQQNLPDSCGCVRLCGAASRTRRSARLPLGALRNICVCWAAGTACSALDGLLHLLAGSLESSGSESDLVPEPQPRQRQPRCGWVFFLHLVSSACAIWSVRIALPSLQPDFVEIAVYLCCQPSQDTMRFISFMNQMKPGPDSNW